VKSLPRTVTQKVQKQELKRIICAELESRASAAAADGKAAV
jgi:hypothetical protein